MKKVLLLMACILFISCHSRQYPNRDGTITAVEYNIFKKDSTVLNNVKYPIYHRIISSVIESYKIRVL